MFTALRVQIQKLNYSDPAVLRGVIMSAISLAASLGVTIPSNLPPMVDSIVAVLAFVIPLVQAIWTRKSVVSPKTHDVKVLAASQSGTLLK